MVYANKQDLIGSSSAAQIAEGLALHTIKVRQAPTSGLRELMQINMFLGQGLADPSLCSHKWGGGQRWHGVGSQEFG